MKNVLKKSRPYLVAYHSYIPSENAKPQTKGFSKSKDWLQREEVEFVDRLKRKQLEMSSVIIDLLKGKVIKNRNGDMYSEKELIDYFSGKYKEKIQGAISHWMKINNLSVPESMIKKIEKSPTIPILNILTEEGIDITDKIKE